MDKRIQSLHNAPSTSNSLATRASNMYFLQVKPNNAEGSEAEAIPLQMLLNEHNAENEQYLISVLQSKHLQLFIDPHAQLSNASGQYYEVTTQEPQINTEFTSSLQILNQVSNQPKSTIGSKDEIVHTLPPEIESNSCNPVVKNLEHQTKVKVVQKFVHIRDRVAPPRAEAVLPGALRLRGAAVAPRRTLPARVRFGPLQGISRTFSPAEVDSLILQSTSSKLPVFLLKTNDTVTHIDVSDKGVYKMDLDGLNVARLYFKEGCTYQYKKEKHDKSNWLSLLPLGDQTTANVWVCQEGDKLYAVTTRPIAARTPLMLGYSKEYVENHKLPVQEPVLDLEIELASRHRQWWCCECQRSVSSAALLQRHIDVHHLEEKQRSQRRYRCRYCTRIFCRMFTLKRHMSRHCTKNVTKPAEPALNMSIECSKAEELPELSLNTTNAEDSRLPSDESLQTLTNNLDFSTNLFDTDRMPNLDISGSSRSEDFNPYSLGLKDDIGLANSIDFPMEPEPCDGKKDVKAENVDTVFLNCRYCNQTFVKGRQRQHAKVCPERKFQCDCGRSFLYKDKLALHIHLDHANEPAAGKESATKATDGPQYKCETCKHTFKRRGMLVNHLWRVHATVSAAVPLERRERLYPCVACPKVYRAAAKRDTHVRAHHPGAELSGARALEGGRRAVAPAACAACPRQYATRAKLLQHVRHHHPALAPPVKKKRTLK